MRTRSTGTIIEQPVTIALLKATNHSAVEWWPVLQPDPGLPASGVVLAGETKYIWGSDYFGQRSGIQSTMTDSTGPDRTYRDCYHEVTDWSNSSPKVLGESRRAMLPDRYSPVAKDITLTLEGTVSGDYFANSMLLDSGSLFTTTDEQMRGMARGQINWSAIAPHIDLPRSVAELKDFSHILKSVWKNLGGVQKVLSSAKAAGVSSNIVMQDLRYRFKRKGNTIVANIRKADAKDYIDAGISADLAWKFMIKPFLTDMGKVMELSAKAEELMKTLSQPVLIPVRGKVQVVSTKNYSWTPSSNNESTTGTSTGTHTCVAWVMLEMASADASFMEALKEVASLRLNLRTAYELVPLSFILEWFVKIGPILSYFDSGRALQRPFRIVSSGYSHKKEVSGVCSVSLLPTAANQLGAPWVATSAATGGGSKKVYTRLGVLIHPSEVTLPPPLKFGLPNLGQAVTLAELIRMFLRSR